MRVEAVSIPTAHPADLSGLERLLDSGKIRAEEIVCIIGKTEGNGGRNDFTRDLAMMALEDLFAARLGVSRRAVGERMIFSLSGGSEGVVCPHIVVFTRSEVPAPAAGKRLTIGTGFTREFRADEIGRMAQIEETARAIGEIVAAMGTSSSDVHLVQMKGAIPTASPDETRMAEVSGAPLRNDMIYSRGASALAVALSLGELARERLRDDVICRDWSLYSSVASCSAKPGLVRTEIMVMANSSAAGGSLRIDHTLLMDMLDVRSMYALLDRLGLTVTGGQLTESQRARLIATFAKSEADPRGTIRGKRHTMLTDDDISDTRQSRCVLSSVIASVTGDPAVYVSTRAEHHGPAGGGTMAVIARVE